MAADERILMTGAAGRIAAALRSRLARKGRTFRLLDVLPVSNLVDHEEAIEASVTDMAAMQEACRDVDVVIHLGGQVGEGSWEHIAEVNINGTYNVFEAARREGVKRVVFASSNHAVGFYPRSAAPAGEYLFPRPDTYYGMSKVAGEALGSLYHDRYGIDVICIRILTFIDRPADLRTLSTWLSHDDAGRLFEACLSFPSPGFRVIWGVSKNTRGWFSLEGARSLGYEPHDDAEIYVEELIAKFGEPNLDEIPHRHVGGINCSPIYDADKFGGSN